MIIGNFLILRFIIYYKSYRTSKCYFRLIFDNATYITFDKIGYNSVEDNKMLLNNLYLSYYDECYKDYLFVEFRIEGSTNWKRLHDLNMGKLNIPNIQIVLLKNVIYSKLFFMKI